MSEVFRNILRRRSTMTEPDAEKGLAETKRENEQEEILDPQPFGDEDEPQTQEQSSSGGSNSRRIQISDRGNGSEGSRRQLSIDPARAVSGPSRRNTRNSRRPTTPRAPVFGDPFEPKSSTAWDLPMDPSLDFTNLSIGRWYPDNDQERIYSFVTQMMPEDHNDTEQMARYKRNYNKTLERVAERLRTRLIPIESPRSPRDSRSTSSPSTETQSDELAAEREDEISLLKQGYLLAAYKISTLNRTVEQNKKELHAANIERESLESTIKENTRIMQACGMVALPGLPETVESPKTSRPVRSRDSLSATKGDDTEDDCFYYMDEDRRHRIRTVENTPNYPRYEPLYPNRPSFMDMERPSVQDSAPIVQPVAAASIQPSAKEFLYHDARGQQAELYVEVLLQSANLSWRLRDWSSLREKVDTAAEVAKQLRYDALDARLDYYQGLVALGQEKWAEALEAFKSARRCRGVYKEGERAEFWVSKVEKRLEEMKDRPSVPFVSKARRPSRPAPRVRELTPARAKKQSMEVGKEDGDTILSRRRASVPPQARMRDREWLERERKARTEAFRRARHLSEEVLKDNNIPSRRISAEASRPRPASLGILRRRQSTQPSPLRLTFEDSPPAIARGEESPRPGLGSDLKSPSVGAPDRTKVQFESISPRARRLALSRMSEESGQSRKSEPVVNNMKLIDEGLPLRDASSGAFNSRQGDPRMQIGAIIDGADASDENPASETRKRSGDAA